MTGPAAHTPWRRLARRLRRRAVRAGRALGLLAPRTAPDRLDLLYGLGAIARFMGLSRNQVRALMAHGAIPAFTLDGVACARRSGIRGHLRKLEAATAPAPVPLSPHQPGITEAPHGERS